MKAIADEFTYDDILNDRTKTALTTFKYNGRDDSILYEYVISPLCDYLTYNWVPKNIAPNLITVIGFLFNVFPHCFVMGTEWLGYKHSREIYFIHGACILLYVVRYHY